MKSFAAHEYHILGKIQSFYNITFDPFNSEASVDSIYNTH